MTVLDLDPEVCRGCGKRGKVIRSRKRPGYRWRRHKCACGRLWSSYQSRLNPAAALRKRAATRPVAPADPAPFIDAAAVSELAHAAPPLHPAPARRVARSAYLGR